MTAQYRSPFLEEVLHGIRVRHYSVRTEQACVDWIKRFILFNGRRHPRDMGESEVGRFLTHLAVQRKVAVSTQNQALNALVFLLQMRAESTARRDPGCGQGEAAATHAGGIVTAGGDELAAESRRRALVGGLSDVRLRVAVYGVRPPAYKGHELRSPGHSRAQR